MKDIVIGGKGGERERERDERERRERERERGLREAGEIGIYRS